MFFFFPFPFPLLSSCRLSGWPVYPPAETLDWRHPAATSPSQQGSVWDRTHRPIKASTADASSIAGVFRSAPDPVRLGVATETDSVNRSHGVTDRSGPAPTPSVRGDIKEIVVDQLLHVRPAMRRQTKRLSDSRSSSLPTLSATHSAPAPKALLNEDPRARALDASAS